MSENILDKIIRNKEKKIDLLKKSLSIENLKIKINENKSFIDFKDKIKKNETESSLAKKILVQEHKLYPKAILKVFNL